ncbi:uncharacterized protein LOC141597480 [Silene latifolia]|uniref:uncharacterized protein LOC141597480 n=1 Tax=Silene latifolia TaxID=37657 RepID=UPI003D76DF2C
MKKEIFSEEHIERGCELELLLLMEGRSRGQRRDGKQPMGSDEGLFEWEEDTGGTTEEKKCVLVGKLWASRAINVKAAVDTMIKLWNPSKPIMGNVIDAKEKTFIFSFGAERDRARVLEGQPWHFDKFVWCFDEPNQSGKISDVPLFLFPIWARIYDLPLSGRTSLENARKLGNCLGNFMHFEHGPNAELDRAIRVRVLYDIREPLKASIPIRMKGGSTSRFAVKYERLPTFCYGCGLIGHGEKDCEEGPYDEEDLKFGEWLRASPWKVVKTEKEGTGKAARNLRPLFDEVEKEDSRDIISSMIEKLQHIALDLKSKKHSEKWNGNTERVGEEEGVSRMAIGEGQQAEEADGGSRIGEVRSLEGMGGRETTCVPYAVEVLMGEGEGGETVDARLKGGQEADGSGGCGTVRGWRRLAREGGEEGGGQSGTTEAGLVTTKRNREESGLEGGQKKSSIHHMDFRVRGDGNEWRITGFYGWPSVTDRHLSWELLRLLQSQSQLPWVCIGDFNEIMYLTEMKGGSRPQWQMNNFRNALDDCGLRCIAWEGYNFSFDNGQAGEANRQSMLDRAVCTGEWTDLFPFARLYYLARDWSDHAPIKLVLNRKETAERRERSFKFEQIWVGEEGSGEAVARGVARGRDDLVTTLEECAKELQAWKKTGIKQISRSIGGKLKQLSKLNEEARSVENIQRRKRLVAELAKLRGQEERFWRQRSRALWLKDGDKNTKFFHTRAGERKSKNHIAKLIDDNGIQRVGDEEVANVANAYFQGLFQSTQPMVTDDILVGVGNRVTAAMNDGLRRAYTEEEITEALNQMHPLKAPGPDGMNGLFYQTYWDQVGPCVTRTVLAILRGELSPREINKTNIVLIPKKKAPDKIREFRPISLCNVAYKLVSKVLANRLKVFLGEIVSENQSAFTPGRAISDNVLIAFEIFNFMKGHKGREGFMALKLDMAKAYDRVEWVFLERVLRAMGFDRAWVRRVMDCVSTVSFSVLINGQPSSTFIPARGLRQGDPLSPYLFILCAEVLSSLMRRAVEQNSLHGVRIARTAPSISHLLFADDSIFFMRASTEEVETVSNVLRRYENASGQLVSREKTTVSFSKGIPRQKRSNLATRLGVVEVEEQERYLGLPTVVGRSKKVLTDILRDKLSKRLSGWRGKILSRAGKEVLIKAVANSLPTYVMSIFKIPVSFCDELRALISRFWWGHDEGKKGISWVAWRKMCKPKGLGGMGFRDFHMFNIALIGKQVWRLLTVPDCLFTKLMRAKYFPNGDVMSASIGNSPSYTWRGMVEAREALMTGWRKRIGDGLSTRVWLDAWLPGTQTGRIITPPVQGFEDLRVADFLEGDGLRWSHELLAQWLLPIDRERVTNIRISPNKPGDVWYWVAEKDGIYSVRSAYRRLAGEAESVEVGGASDWEKEKWLWNRLWKIPVWPRVKLFFWQLCSEALATRANIATRIRGECSFCSFCNSYLESDLHLFRDCAVAKRVWEGLGLDEETEDSVGGVRDWVEAKWRAIGGREHSVFMVGCWALWEHRNKVVFDGKEVDPWGVIRRVEDVMEEIEGGGFARPRGGVHEGGAGGGGKQRGWVAPHAGHVKVNVDAGVKEGRGVSGGAVCRDERGEVLWGLSWVVEQE